MRKAIGAASDADLQKLKKESEKDIKNIKKVIICMDEELKFLKIMSWINVFFTFSICIYLILRS